MAYSSFGSLLILRHLKRVVILRRVKNPAPQEATCTPLGRKNLSLLPLSATCHIPAHMLNCKSTSWKKKNVRVLTPLTNILS